LHTKGVAQFCVECSAILWTWLLSWNQSGSITRWSGREKKWVW